ncbi:MAG: PaaI family thioesterase [Anaerolineales bacterium]|nr:PaaI family thioesterase [Anaerolineales bacterium]
MSKIKQPNSKMCFVCGLENPVGLKLNIYQIEPGVIEAIYIAPDHFQGYPGVLHGGIVATMLDEMSGRALMGDPSEPRFMYTGKIEVKYRGNVPINVPLRIVGKAGKSKKRTAEGWAGIYGPDEKLLAEASTLLFNVPDETLDSANLEELGWKVYPD